MIKVFDFFSGCGGTSRGFKDVGFEIICALDNDPEAAATYKQNFPKTTFINDDITKVNTSQIKTFINSCGNDPILFCKCAPCQPFSKQKQKKIKTTLSVLTEILAKNPAYLAQTTLRDDSLYLIGWNK